MKNFLSLFFFSIAGFALSAQTPDIVNEGVVSYVTSQNVYVKFQSTQGISIGDTLFSNEGTILLPVMIVKELSSISCVCVTLAAKKFEVNSKLVTRNKVTRPVERLVISPITEEKPVSTNIDTISAKIEATADLKQQLAGRISVSAYSNFSNVSDFSQRMKYTFSMNAQNISSSKLSAETYISFVHKINEWSEVKEDIFNGLKIYSLSANYAFNSKNNVWMGRKSNPRLSNVGAIDGFQYETKFKSFIAGVFAGTRPDYMNYSFNANLLQYGGYFGYDYSNKLGGSMQSSIAFVEQKNNGKTDRRFAYLQHTNTMLGKLYFFGSVEFDLYNKVLNSEDSSYTQDNTPNLSNLYVSLRYKVIKQLSLSVSYSERQNIIYYETYKSIIDQLLEEATMKGFQFQVNYSPLKKFSFGVNTGYRYSKYDPRPTKNLYTHVTYTNVPWINASATLSATFLETGYMKGNIYSLGLARDLISGKVYSGLNYRYVKYEFVNNETPLAQNIAEINFTWRIIKKLSCSLNYEGTFEKGRNYDRIYINLTQRF